MVLCQWEQLLTCVAGFSEINFFSPDQHDLQIQLMVFYVKHAVCCVLVLCLSSVQAIIFVSYSLSCMVYKVVQYLFFDIFNADIIN